MPLRTSLRTLKSLGIFSFKSKKKKGESLDPTMTQPTTMARPGMKQDPPCNANSTIRHLKNFDELIKRLHNLFLQYQIPLSEGRPIVFDEVRCSQALNLHLLLSIQAPDLLDSEKLASSFELHNLGLRLPGNPLRMNPTCSPQEKIRQAMEKELGSIFGNTSLEALGLITVLHVLEKATSWLEPLLSMEGIARVQINVEMAQQPLRVASHDSSNAKNSDISKSNRRSVNYAPGQSDGATESITSPRRHSQSLAWRSPQISHSQNGTIFNSNQTQDRDVASKFSPGRHAYNFNKESPENALDRWVLEARSHGHEPTLEECIRKSYNLAINYKTARYEPGILPPPVSTSYGRVQHALYLHLQKTPRQHDQSPQPDVSSPFSPVQEDIETSSAGTPTHRPSTPYRHRRTTQHIVRVSANGTLHRRSKPIVPLMPVVEESPKARKTPPRLLRPNGSPSKSKRSSKMRIGSPSQITHQASGAGLASYDDIVKAMLAANEGFGQSKQVESVVSNTAVKSQPDQDQAERDVPQASAASITSRKHTLQSLSSTTSRNAASHAQEIQIKATTLHDLPADKHFQHRAATTVRTPPEQVPSQAWTPSGVSSFAPLDDQDAKVEALLTQLRLMQDVFSKARDSLKESVGSRFIERVTDIAVGYGWFKASCRPAM